MQEELERLIRDAIGIVLGTDSGQSPQRQHEVVKEYAAAIIALFEPGKKKHAA